jgi:hypothetical protein
MQVKTIIDEDFINYKRPSMVIAFPTCHRNCKECQNAHIRTLDNIEISIPKVIQRFIENPLTEAIVCQGLEPFDSFSDVWKLVETLRDDYKSNVPIVIYSGYSEDEIPVQKGILSAYENIIIKFGEYQAGQNPHYDDVLGVFLASDNQYGKQIS